MTPYDRIALPKVTGGPDCFFGITIAVFPPWDCVKIHLNAPEQQSPKTSAFTKVVTLADDQLTKSI